MAPCSLITLYRRFRGTHFLYLQGASVLKVETVLKNIFSGSVPCQMVQISQHLGAVKTLMTQMESVSEMFFGLYQLTELLTQGDIIEFCYHEGFKTYMESVCFLKMLSTYQTTQCHNHNNHNVITTTMKHKM
jgi:hypothetical protein